MKYIIKNCPARFNKVNGEQGCTDNLKKLCLDCHEVSDCLLKRIVELCEVYQQCCRICPTHDVCFECESVSGKHLSDEIMKLLEIEEVNERNNN